MTLYLVAAAVAAAVSAGITVFLIRFARARGLFLPAIRERDSHTLPTPRVGGIAIVASFLLVSMALALAIPDQLRFVAESVWRLDRNLVGVLLGVLALTVVNIIDDQRGVAWPIKLAVQVVAALCVFWFGIRIPWLSSPFGGRIFLESIAWLFVVVWLVGLSNVVNWLDGVDGLSGSVGAVALAVLFFLSVSPNVAQHSNALLAAIAFGALIGFLPFNLPPAKAFLGDTGAVFLGFIIGVLAIISGGKVATAFLVLAIPFIDAIVVFWTRVAHGRSPFLADRIHLHHRLLDLGFRPWQITGVFVAISLAFGLLALNTQTLGKLGAAVAALLLVALFLAFYAAVMRARARQAAILEKNDGS